MSLRNFINARFNPNTDIYHLIRTDDIGVTYEFDLRGSCKIVFGMQFSYVHLWISDSHSLKQIIANIEQNVNSVYDNDMGIVGEIIIIPRDYGKITIYSRLGCTFDVHTVHGIEIDKDRFLNLLREIQSVWP